MPFRLIRDRVANVTTPTGPHDTPGASVVRPMVFGASDGLVSNLALVMGVGAAAGTEGNAIVIAGIAGLLAGAFSMAVGEYISVRSQREILDYQVRLQKAQLADDPDSEAAILRAIYRTKGLSEAESDLIVSRVMADHGLALDTFVREEIGLSEATMGSPLAAGGSSFVAFSIGAIVPVIPYLLFNGMTAFWVSLVVSTIALFGVGAAVSLLTHRPPLLVGARQAGLGLAAAAVTYAIGTLMGASGL
ncbi:MAG TPA: VIT1/CCC1 transporter family protein [Candidatus Limnocylindrales bacterium]|nr:VIT1/CCC1 transporter family protein [Candidatus Limnocylindrales bacterium]